MLVLNNYLEMNPVTMLYVTVKEMSIILILSMIPKQRRKKMKTWIVLFVFWPVLFLRRIDLLNFRINYKNQ